ncbi:hypothetical protein V8D89_013956 [Ganoderma adspersum]
MSLDNSTGPDFHGIEVNILALDVVRDPATAWGEIIVDLSSNASIDSHRGSFSQTNFRVLLLSIVLLYLSTVMYMAALVWNWWSAYRLTSRATDDLFSPSYDGRGELVALDQATCNQSWVATIALGINVLQFIIGDAIVWWRACVIWRNRVVYCLGPLLVTVILGMF